MVRLAEMPAIGKPHGRLLIFICSRCTPENRAGRMGFEPMTEFKPGNRLAGGPNRPLWHLPLRWCRLVLGCQPEGGGRGIRTPGELAPTAVFKTAAIVHSAIPPAEPPREHRPSIACAPNGVKAAQKKRNYRRHRFHRLKKIYVICGLHLQSV